VVLPTILGSSQEIEELVSRLEIHFLANNDDNLDFALLSDFPDADVEFEPQDEALLLEARDQIDLLNRAHPRAQGNRFHLYHRKRMWNESEQKWMGHERKRGKLEEFNRMLLGGRDTTYGQSRVPEGIQFIVTVDSDTILPRDSVRKLVGCLLHPLN